MIVFHLKDTSARIHSSLCTIIMYTLHIQSVGQLQQTF